MRNTSNFQLFLLRLTLVHFQFLFPAMWQYALQSLSHLPTYPLLPAYSPPFKSARNTAWSMSNLTGFDSSLWGLTVASFFNTRAFGFVNNCPIPLFKKYLPWRQFYRVYYYTTCISWFDAIIVTCTASCSVFCVVCTVVLQV